MTDPFEIMLTKISSTQLGWVITGCVLHNLLLFAGARYTFIALNASSVSDTDKQVTKPPNLILFPHLIGLAFSLRHWYV